VPAHAIIIREYFAPREAGARTGIVLMATLFGMALGGWMSGAIFDFTGSYRAAFFNSIAFNLLNLTIVLCGSCTAHNAAASCPYPKVQPL
jgi:MFS family permease